jgi:hypothetical protein
MYTFLNFISFLKPYFLHKMNKNLLSTLGLCLCIGILSAQISFNNQVNLLTDPTHYSGNAVTVQDVNGDGLDDLVILDDAKNLRIEFQNLDGTWTAYIGGTMDNQDAWGMVVADTDNNGYADIFSGVNGENPDYAKANADGTDWVITGLTGYSLFYQGSSLGDVDNDGDLDLYVCADTDESAIWENDGDGNMTISGASLIDLTVIGWDGSGNYGSTFTDFDLDGDLDLYIAHCRQGVNDPSDPRRINQLYVNDGNNNYTESAADYGLALGAQSWTADFGDIDNDGDFDIFITNHDVPNMLLMNLDDSDEYEDIYVSSGLSTEVGLPIQGLLKDFDNDMYLDIFITGSDHALFHNNGDNTFTLVENAFTGSAMESFAVGDINHDGFSDIYGSYADIYNSPSATPDAVWINDGNDNHFLTVVLEGTITNRSAVGTVVRAYGPWGQQVREVRAGESYGVNNTLHMNFGLAQNTQVDSVVIDWPTSGIHQVIENPLVDQFLTVIENECIAPSAIVTASGSTVLCLGQTLGLNAGSDPNNTYLWSNGSTESTISVMNEGSYMVQITDMSTGCSSISAAIQVQQSPDETPTVSADGVLQFCNGSSVTLTSSSAADYSWSNAGETAQSITVTEAGEYTVTINGVCESFTSEGITVTTLASPSAIPSADDVVIGSAQVVTLSAAGTGDLLRWYDLQVGGTVLGTGADFTTPVINATTSYWVEASNLYEGPTGLGGKENNNPSMGQYHTNANFYLRFDAYEDFILNSVKVYADVTESRTIQLRNSGGNIILTSTQEIPAGESYVTLDFEIPAGTNYSLRGSGDPGLWRDNDPSGVNFPYPIATFGSITGTNAGAGSADDLYYFFYDWQVSLAEQYCSSEREEVIIELSVGLNEGEDFSQVRTYPNPSEGILNIEFAKQVKGRVQLSIHDIKGKEILSESLNSVNVGQRTILDLSEIAKGSYVLRILSDQGSYTEQVILE